MRPKFLLLPNLCGEMLGISVQTIDFSVIFIIKSLHDFNELYRILEPGEFTLIKIFHHSKSLIVPIKYNVKS